MNYYTNSAISSFDPERDGACEHIANGSAPIAAVTAENDSCGTIDRWAECSACYQARLSAEDEEEHRCDDCRQSFRLIDGGLLWKSFDHYPPQGDEPLPICGACRVLPKHVARVAQDAKDEAYEMAAYADYDEEEV